MKVIQTFLFIAVLCFCVPMTVCATDDIPENKTELVDTVKTFITEVKVGAQDLIKSKKLEPYMTSIKLFGLLVIVAIIGIIIVKRRF